MKIRNLLINLILLLSSVIITFAVLGYGIIKSDLITQTPLKFDFALPPAMALLAQSSKQGIIPTNYIAIVGDSYAKGAGDWLLATDANTNAPFQAAHVLHQLTGRDLINFGKSGASNIKGWVREPTSLYTFVHNVIDSSLEPPKYVLAYFYAGNDLDDNVWQLQEDFIPSYGDPLRADAKTWEHYFAEQTIHNKVGPYRHLNTTFGWLIQTSAQVIKKSLRSGDEVQAVKSEKFFTANQVMIHDTAEAFPSTFQAPGLGLSNQQTDLAFSAASHSLQALIRFFPKSTIVVIYVPSPAESYAVTSTHITVQEPRGNASHIVKTKYATEKLSRRSNEITNRLQRITKEQNVFFIDTRADIQRASQHGLLHGPIDMIHFNEAGYVALAHSIACHMAQYKLWDEQVCPAPTTKAQEN